MHVSLACLQPQLPSSRRTLVLPSLPLLPCRNDNSLSGTIPASWLPPRITSLDASSNRLSLPPNSHLPLPASLVRLSLFSNPLNGSIPPGLAHLTRLQALDLHNCSLRGMLPFGPWPPSLTSLSLEANNLSGALPPDPLPPSLTSLALDSNNLTGTLPSKPLPPSLTRLSLASNLFRGSVPWAAWDMPASLQALYLGSNLLTGPLPATLPASFEAFSLGNNLFSGSMPPGLLTRLPTNLSLFDVSSNRLTGPLPERLSLPHPHPYHPPVDLNLSNNSLSGTLPWAWDCDAAWAEALARSTTFNLSSNQLSGTLPTNLPLLRCGTVDLSLNHLTGGLECAASPLCNQCINWQSGWIAVPYWHRNCLPS